MLERQADSAQAHVQPAEDQGRLLFGVAFATGLAYAVLAHRFAPGLGLAVVLTAATLTAGRLGRDVADRETQLWLAMAAIPAALLGVRQLPAIQALNLLAWTGLLAAALGTRRRGSLAGWMPSRLVVETLTGLSVLITPARVLTREVGGDSSRLRKAISRSGPVALGIALAVPLVAVFWLLLASSDAVFEDLSAGALRWVVDVPNLAGRVVATVVSSWIALGVFGGMRRPVRSVEMIEDRWQRPPATTVLIPLVAVAALFLCFVMVQFAYFFGGADTVARTGLSYAEYARRGFFELVAVAALVVGVVAGADWLAQNPAGPRVRAVDWASRALVVLTLIMAVAALRRMLLYVDAFGLSELRVYTTAFLLWVAMVLAWLWLTVLKGGRQRFAVGAVVSALCVTLALNAIHPAALIARVNLDRVAHGADLDVDYVLGRGSGAVPALTAGIDQLADPCLRAALVRGLAVTEGPDDWRAGTVDDLFAQRSLAQVSLVEPTCP